MNGVHDGAWSVFVGHACRQRLGTLLEGGISGHAGSDWADVLRSSRWQAHPKFGDAPGVPALVDELRVHDDRHTGGDRRREATECA